MLPNPFIEWIIDWAINQECSIIPEAEDTAQKAHCIPISLRMTRESAWLMAGRMILESHEDSHQPGLRNPTKGCRPTNCSQTPSGGLHTSSLQYYACRHFQLAHGHPSAPDTSTPTIGLAPHRSRWWAHASVGDQKRMLHENRNYQNYEDL